MIRKRKYFRLFPVRISTFEKFTKTSFGFFFLFFSENPDHGSSSSRAMIIYTSRPMFVCRRRAEMKIYIPPRVTRPR